MANMDTVSDGHESNSSDEGRPGPSRRLPRGKRPTPITGSRQPAPKRPKNNYDIAMKSALLGKKTDKKLDFLGLDTSTDVIEEAKDDLTTSLADLRANAAVFEHTNMELGISVPSQDQKVVWPSNGAMSSMVQEYCQVMQKRTTEAQHRDRQEIHSLKDKNVKLHQQLREVNANAKAGELTKAQVDKFRKLEEQVTELDERIVNKDFAMVMYKECEKLSKEDIVQLKTDKNILQEAINASRASEEGLKQQLEEARSERDQSVRLVKAKTDQNAKLVADTDALRLQLAAKDNALQAARAQVVKRDQDFADQRTISVQRQAELQTLKEQVQNVQDQADSDKKRSQEQYSILDEQMRTDIRRRDNKVEQLEAQAQQHNDAMLAHKTQAKNNIDRCFERIYEQQKQIDEAQERFAILGQERVQDRQAMMGELMNLLGVSMGDYEQTLSRLGIDCPRWYSDNERHHYQGHLAIGSSLMLGRPPMVLQLGVTIPRLPHMQLLNETLADRSIDLRRDINYKLMLVSSYLSTSDRGRATPLLWDVWAVLEGTEVYTEDIEAVTSAVASVARTVFRLFSDGSITDIGFWIATQMVCSLLRWDFHEMALEGILPLDHPSRRIDRPLVVAGLSRFLGFDLDAHLMDPLRNELFASFEGCVERFPEVFKLFKGVVEGKWTPVILCDLSDSAEILVLIQDPMRQCVIWHDGATKCSVVEHESVKWLRLDRARFGQSMYISIDGDLGLWMVKRFGYIDTPDCDLDRLNQQRSDLAARRLAPAAMQSSDGQFPRCRLIQQQPCGLEW